MLGLGCGGDAAPSPIIAAGQCGAIETVEILPSPHSDDIMPSQWNSNPPTSGPHSPAWAQWDYQYEQLARKHWVHNLEHGGVVLAYHCEDGCADVIAGLQDIIVAAPDDPLCALPVHHRLLLVQDPLLPAGVQVAAVAWGVAYTATCFDRETIEAFIEDHYGRGPEATCAEGGALEGEPIFPQ